jgi:hypothetical protein
MSGSMQCPFDVKAVDDLDRSRNSSRVIFQIQGARRQPRPFDHSLRLTEASAALRCRTLRRSRLRRSSLPAFLRAARRQVQTVAARSVARRLNADTSDHGRAISGLRVRPGRSLCRTSGKSCSEHTGRTQAGSGLLSLSALQQRILSARPASGYREDLLFSCHRPRDWNRRFDGQFSGRQPVVEELAGIGIHASQGERGAEALGDEIASDERFRRTIGGAFAAHSLPGPRRYRLPMRAEELAGRFRSQWLRNPC